MIDMTTLRRLHDAVTKGPGKLSTTAALIALAPDLAAAVLDHPAALRAAMIRGYEIALEEAARNGIGLPRADKCAALLDILTEYPDAH